jgi:hypothetical protein
MWFFCRKRKRKLTLEERIDRNRDIIMATAQEVLDSLTALRDNSLEVSAKMDQISAKIDLLQQAGNGATQAQIDEIATLVNEASGLVQTTEDKQDLELTSEG